MVVVFGYKAALRSPVCCSSCYLSLSVFVLSFVCGNWNDPWYVARFASPSFVLPCWCSADSSSCASVGEGGSSEEGELVGVDFFALGLSCISLPCRLGLQLFPIS